MGINHESAAKCKQTTPLAFGQCVCVCVCDVFKCILIQSLLYTQCHNTSERHTYMQTRIVCVLLLNLFDLLMYLYKTLTFTSPENFASLDIPFEPRHGTTAFNGTDKLPTGSATQACQELQTWTMHLYL